MNNGMAAVISAAVRAVVRSSFMMPSIDRTYPRPPSATGTPPSIEKHFEPGVALIKIKAQYARPRGARAAVTMGLTWLNSLSGIFGYLSLHMGGGAMTIPDYIAIGVLIVLAVWAVADWVPRGKL